MSKTKPRTTPQAKNELPKPPPDPFKEAEKLLDAIDDRARSIRMQLSDADDEVLFHQAKREWAARKVERLVGGNLRSAADVKALADETWEDHLFRSLLESLGGWDKFKAGATDGQICDHIAKTLQGRYRNQFPDFTEAERTGYGPKLQPDELRAWIKTDPKGWTNSPIVQKKGKALIDLVRRLMKIPPPAAAPPVQKKGAPQKPSAPAKVAAKLAARKAASAKPKSSTAKPKSSGSIGFRPQTFGQWLSTARGCMHPLKLDEGDARWKEAFDAGEKPSDAARRIKATIVNPPDADAEAAPAKPAKKLKQTFNQWKSTLLSILSGRFRDAPLPEKDNAGNQATLQGLYDEGMQPGDAAERWAQLTAKKQTPAEPIGQPVLVPMPKGLNASVTIYPREVEPGEWRATFGAIVAGYHIGEGQETEYCTSRDNALYLACKAVADWIETFPASATSTKTLKAIDQFQAKLVWHPRASPGTADRAEQDADDEAEQAAGSASAEADRRAMEADPSGTPPADPNDADRIGPPISLEEAGIKDETLESLKEAFSYPTLQQRGTIKRVIQNDEGQDYAVMGMSLRENQPDVFSLVPVALAHLYAEETETWAKRKKTGGRGKPPSLEGVKAGCEEDGETYVFVDVIAGQINIAIPKGGASTDADGLALPDNVNRFIRTLEDKAKTYALASWKAHATDLPAPDLSKVRREVDLGIFAADEYDDRLKKLAKEAGIPWQQLIGDAPEDQPEKSKASARKKAGVA